MRHKGLILVSVCLLAVSAAGAATLVGLWPGTALYVQSPETRLRAAELALSEGRANDAESLLKPLAESGDPRIHGLLGRVYAELRNSSLAIFHFLKAHDKDRDNLDSNRGLGRAYSELGLHDLALPYLERVVQLDPNDAGAWKCLSRVFQVRKLYSDASRALRRAVQLNPADVSAMRELGELTVRQARPLAPHEVRPTCSVPSMSSFTDSRPDSVGRRP